MQIRKFTSNDLVMWPNGDCCFWDELEEYGASKSDDYEIIHESDPRYEAMTADLD